MVKAKRSEYLPALLVRMSIVTVLTEKNVAISLKIVSTHSQKSHF